MTSRPSSNSVIDELADVRRRRWRGMCWPACRSRDATIMPDQWQRSIIGCRMDLTLPLDYAAIERILPHRYPFLLVDRITELEVDKRIVGIKNVSLNERYLSHAGERHRRCCRRRSSPKRSRRSARS